MTSEKLITTCAKLYGMRESARQIFGVKWRDEVHPLMEIVRAVGKRDGLDTIPAMMKLAKEVEADARAKGYDPGVTVMLLAAAAVEILEPSREGK